VVQLPILTHWSVLTLLRENPEKLKWSQQRRGLSQDIVDRARQLDAQWRQTHTRLGELRHLRNVLTQELSRLRDEERAERIDEAKKLSQQIDEMERRETGLLEELHQVLLSLPNVVHETTPVGAGEEDNLPFKYVGRPKVWEGFEANFRETYPEVDHQVISFKPATHVELGESFKYVDTERAARAASSRFYYLFDDLVWLDLALQTYALRFLQSRGFRLVEPPHMLRRSAYEGVTSITDFEDAIYKVEGEDLYLIATSEHAIAALHMNEVLPEKSLPLLYAGVSPCYRKEAGAHGKDTKGIFRVHQFNKVEQFVFCLPSQSWEWFERLLQNAEALVHGLGIPYRVVNICTGDLGAVAAKKCDIETWMPGQGLYREVISCSNCTDWQTVRLGVKYAEQPGKEIKGYVHSLNATALATGRMVTAILENYQNEDGVVTVPDALRPILRAIRAEDMDVIKPSGKR